MTFFIGVLCAAVVFVAGSDRRVSPAFERLRRHRVRTETVIDVPTKPDNAKLPYLACGVLGLAVVWLIGGAAGIVAGLAVGIGGPLMLGRFESSSTRARRQVLEANASLVCDMFVACLASGTSINTAADATARALEGEVAQVLDRCVALFRLGGSPAQVWEPMLAEPALAPIARAILRSAQTGAPLATVLQRVGEDLRAIRRSVLERAAQAVGVKAVAPLGLCFLPAFVLLGVVPLIASLVIKGIAM